MTTLTKYAKTDVYLIKKNSDGETLYNILFEEMNGYKVRIVKSYSDGRIMVTLSWISDLKKYKTISRSEARIWLENKLDLFSDWFLEVSQLEAAL